MSLDESSLQVNITISADSKITEYSFLWQNFSIIQGNQLIFGDVFQVPDFFSQLYGDAALQVSYPANFTVESVTPPPYQRDDSARTLEWARTQDLASAQTNIVLTNTSPPSDSQSAWQEYVIIGIVIVAIATLSFVGFYTFRRRKNNLMSNAALPTPVILQFETEEDKVLKLLKSSGGSMRQSNITESCRFSKAKTSQLLAALEKNGNITRYKKGRDKIVNLKEERVKGEKI
jgi:uncharacterized membrane protein